MTILRLSKRALSIVLVVLGFVIAFYEPVAAKKANDYLTKSEFTTLIHSSNWQQAREYSAPDFTDKMTSMQPDSAKPANPTPEMVVFFERRTRDHIASVTRNLTLLAKLSGYPKEILSRGKIHDASKFTPHERVPYIWLTEFHRRRQTGEAFTYPTGIEEQVKASIQHHLTTNRHHPEFHAEPDAMSDVDIIEMVCDWTAIAQERGENGGSARQWADNNVGDQKRFKFSQAKKQFIYRVIDDLDRNVGIERGTRESIVSPSTQLTP